MSGQPPRAGFGTELGTNDSSQTETPGPNQIGQHRLIRYLIGAVVVISVALLIPMPRGGRAWDEFNNLCHAPVFAVLAALAHAFLASRLPGKITVFQSFLCWAAIGAFGLASEGLQSLTGRSASWHDLRSNLAGAAIGILLNHARWQTGLPRIRLAAVALLLFLAVQWWPLAMLWDCLRQRLAFPVMSSFESPFETHRWIPNDQATLKRARLNSTDGEWSLHVHLAPGTYPSLIYRDPVGDWRSYNDLALDILVPGDITVPLIVKIEDQDHELTHRDPRDRFERQFRLQPGWNFLRIPLEDVRRAPQNREMDLGRMYRLQLYVHKIKVPMEFFLDHLRLER